MGVPTSNPVWECRCVISYTSFQRHLITDTTVQPVSLAAHSWMCPTQAGVSGVSFITRPGTSLVVVCLLTCDSSQTYRFVGDFGRLQRAVSKSDLLGSKQWVTAPSPLMAQSYGILCLIALQLPVALDLSSEASNLSLQTILPWCIYINLISCFLLITLSGFTVFFLLEPWAISISYMHVCMYVCMYVCT
jgi:hypothetical protein